MCHLKIKRLTVHHHLEITHIRMFREKLYRLFIDRNTRLLRLKSHQDLLLTNRIKEFIIYGNLNPVIHTVQREHLFLNADIGLDNRNQMVTLSVECAVIGVRYGYRNKANNKGKDFSHHRLFIGLFRKYTKYR